MVEQSLFYRILSWFLEKIGFIKKYDVSKSEMCKLAVDAGVCPNACDRCAWGERKDNV